MATITNRVLRASRHHGLPVLSRRQWGSRLPHVYAWRRLFRKHSLLPKKPADTLVQHITVTHDTGRSRDSFKADVRLLESIGQARFKSGISYSAAWDMKTGLIALGQPFDAKGTHTLNDKNIPGFSFDQNAVAIAIAAVGMPGDKPTPQAIDILASFIGVLIVQKVLTKDFDYEPHSRFAYKDCPTEAVREIMPEVRRKAIIFAQNH